MGSTFSWMTHSDAEQRRVLDAIDKFKETEARDELGLGGIRDAFADELFPGTSTIQTRARYFLFVPWVYRELENKRALAKDVASLARKAETSVASALKATSQDDRGIIGYRAGDSVKRLPSSVYWFGLSSWDIRRFHGSLSSYHRSFDRLGRSVLRDDDGEPLDGGPRPAWDPALPRAPERFPKNLTFDLTAEEAAYLAGKIQQSNPRSLLAVLVRGGRASANDVNYPWEHPDLPSWRPDLSETVELARVFAEVMHGAALLYNAMLAELRAKEGGPDDAALHDHYRTGLATWAEEVRRRDTSVAAWNHGAFWRFVHARARVSSLTTAFVDGWVGLQAWKAADGGASDPAARQLVERRERQLKGARSRLANVRALELWGGASGVSRLEYRWNATRRLLADIEAGNGSTSHA